MRQRPPAAGGRRRRFEWFGLARDSGCSLHHFVLVDGACSEREKRAKITSVQAGRRSLKEEPNGDVAAARRSAASGGAWDREAEKSDSAAACRLVTLCVETCSAALGGMRCVRRGPGT